MNTMITTNKAQLMAALGCVQEDPRTEDIVIEARGDDDRLLCRYKFPRQKGTKIITYSAGTARYVARIKCLISQVRRTPANIWR